MKTLYQILEIEIKATADEIKAAYRKLVKQYHPDLNKEAGATERFMEIQKAFETLGDENKRQQYDLILNIGFASPRGTAYYNPHTGVRVTYTGTGIRSADSIRIFVNGIEVT